MKARFFSTVPFVVVLLVALMLPFTSVSARNLDPGKEPGGSTRKYTEHHAYDHSASYTSYYYMLNNVANITAQSGQASLSSLSKSYGKGMNISNFNYSGLAQTPSGSFYLVRNTMYHYYPW